MALRDIITRDLGWKLFSLFLAVIIWVTVKTVSQESPAQAANPLEDWEIRTLNDMPVLVVSEAEDVRQFKVSPDHVQVTVRSSPDMPLETLEREVHVTVDLTDIESSRGLRKKVDVSTPPGVILESVTPEDLYVVIPPVRTNKQ
jgi:YbbR domain-containing protein